MGLSIATLEHFDVGLLPKLLDPGFVSILAVAALKDFLNHIAGFFESLYVLACRSSQ